jgi:site-specific recombinase XerD
MMDKLDQFLAYLKHEMHALPNSVISYKSDLSLMLDYFKERNIELENVDHKVIRDYLLTLHKSQRQKEDLPTICCIFRHKS